MGVHVSGGRWKYKTDTVTVGENSVVVRQLTVRERLQFANASKAVKEGKLEPIELPKVVLQAGIEGLSDQESLDMPADLVDAAVNRILELSGIRDEKKAPAPEEEAATH